MADAVVSGVFGTLKASLRPAQASGLGYGVFSVSHFGVGEVARYIAQQEKHHRKRSFSEELRMFVERYGLQWQEGDETVGNGFTSCAPPAPR